MNPPLFRVTMPDGHRLTALDSLPGTALGRLTLSRGDGPVVGYSAMIRWHDDGQVEEAYLSLSASDTWEHDPEGLDQFGVPDDEILFYTSERDIIAREVGGEFDVLDLQPVYLVLENG